MTGLSNRELREMRAAAGELFPDTANLLSITRTSDSQGGFTEAWGTAVKNVPCRMDSIVGSERATDGSTRAFHVYELAIPYDTTVSTDYRVEYSGAQYHITAVDTPQSWSIERVLQLEKLS